MKNILIGVLLIATLVSTGINANAQSKLGHINSLELLSLMPEVKKVDTQLESLAKELDGQYQAYLAELQNKYKDYEANVASWSETKKDAMETDIKTLEGRIQEFQQTSQQKVTQRREELLAPILATAEKAINEVGEENGYTYVIDSSTGALVFSGKDAVDILPMVKVKLNLP